MKHEIMLALNHNCENNESVVKYCQNRFNVMSICAR